jgi:phosphoribosyl 1,2-cyclic phosphodiesterase
MTDGSRLQLKFWGVRGSSPTPLFENLEHGGNTSCLEIRPAGGEVLIFDGGTGSRGLGGALMREAEGGNLSLKFFLTHFHWDHIQGIPFFAPLYREGNSVTFYSFPEADTLRATIEGQMETPYFPVNFVLHARRDYVQMREPLDLNGPVVRSFPLNHPQHAVGYRIEHQGASIVYASDLEHGNARLDKVLRDCAEGADVLVYDAQYTAEEYATRAGWGHSTWAEATRVARDAQVKQLILFHHDPAHGDDMMREIVDRARQSFENSHAAREGWTIEV